MADDARPPVGDRRRSPLVRAVAGWWNGCLLMVLLAGPRDQPSVSWLLALLAMVAMFGLLWVVLHAVEAVSMTRARIVAHVAVVGLSIVVPAVYARTDWAHTVGLSAALLMLWSVWYVLVVRGR